MQKYKRKLLTYAYHIIGSYEDSKDIVQDVFEKYIDIDKSTINNEYAFLVRSVINHSINFKERKQRFKKYVTQLPEPISAEMADWSLMKEDIASYTMMVLMEKLNPRERAVFVLVEGFDYSHEEAARTLSITIDNSRKLLSRAKGKIKTEVGVPAKRSYSKTGDACLKKYVDALKEGNISLIEKIFSEDISVSADGGGKIKVISEFLVGRKAVSKVLCFVFNTYQRKLKIKLSKVNQQPALIFFNKSRVIYCQVFELAPKNIIKHIYAVIDPDKLKNISV